ncbi:MAG TPA: HlyD family secretion protein [Sphingobium sp.]
MNDTTAPPSQDPVITEDPQIDPPPRGWRPPARSRTTVIAIVAIAVLAILAILYAWQLPPFSGWAEKTDNAYVRGKVTIISPQVSGYVMSVPVQDFGAVKAGQVLATIDDRIYKAKVEQAKANLAAQIAGLSNSQQSQRSREAALTGQEAAIGSARAQLVKAQADMKRADALVADGSISERERDQTRAALLAAQAAVSQAGAAQQVGQQDVRSVLVGRGGLEAAVEGARAALHLAQIDLDNTVIRAPTDGQLSEVGVRSGAYVTAGTQLMFLVPRDMWVIANFKEAQTRGMRIGQRATFKVDALGSAKLSGRVENMSPAAGSEFAVLKPDNATGNFVKVAQRIAVRVKVDPGQDLAKRLRPGMSVEIRIDTGE